MSIRDYTRDKFIALLCLYMAKSDNSISWDEVKTIVERHGENNFTELYKSYGKVGIEEIDHLIKDYVLHHDLQDEKDAILRELEKINILDGYTDEEIDKMAYLEKLFDE